MKWALTDCLTSNVQGLTNQLSFSCISSARGLSCSTRARVQSKLPNDVGRAVYDAVTAVTDRWAKQRKREERDASAIANRHARLAGKDDDVSFKSAAYEAISAAYAAASDTGSCGLQPMTVRNFLPRFKVRFCAMMNGRTGGSKLSPPARPWPFERRPYVVCNACRLDPRQWFCALRCDGNDPTFGAASEKYWYGSNPSLPITIAVAITLGWRERSREFPGAAHIYCGNWPRKILEKTIHLTPRGSISYLSLEIALTLHGSKRLLLAFSAN